MELQEAKSMRIKLGHKSHLTREEEFLYIELMRFLIFTEKRAADMMCLGEHYYSRRCFDLALKYYDMAAAYGLADANLRLGCLWYYGRVGAPDYEKAFFYFSKAREQGNLRAAYFIADMYKYGQYVEADYDTYKEIIEGLEIKVVSALYTEDPLPEVFVRLADIRTREYRYDLAEEYYLAARDFLAQRILYNPSFGNLYKMRDLIYDYYRIAKFDAEKISFFDLYHCLRKPCKVTFTYNDQVYEVESLVEDGDVVVRFEDRWFRSIDAFFANAAIGEELLTSIYDEFSNYAMI